MQLNTLHLLTLIGDYLGRWSFASLFVCKRKNESRNILFFDFVCFFFLLVWGQAVILRNIVQIVSFPQFLKCFGTESEAELLSVTLILVHLRSLLNWSVAYQYFKASLCTLEAFPNSQATLLQKNPNKNKNKKTSYVWGYIAKKHSPKSILTNISEITVSIFEQHHQELKQDRTKSCLPSMDYSSVCYCINPALHTWHCSHPSCPEAVGTVYQVSC